MTAKQIFMKVRNFNDMCLKVGYEKVRIRFTVEGGYVDKTYDGSDYDKFVKDVQDEFYDWASEAILKYRNYQINNGATAVKMEQPFGEEFTEYVLLEIEKF